MNEIDPPPRQRLWRDLPWFRYVKVHASAHCYALGELIGETATRYIYHNRAGVAFVSKSSLIHLAPCGGCEDYQEREEVV